MSSTLYLIACFNTDVAQADYGFGTGSLSSIYIIC